MLPFAQTGNTYAAVLRRAGNGYDVETRLQTFERFVGKQAFAGDVGVLIEGFYFVGCISFGQDSYVNALFGAAALQQIFVSVEETTLMR